MENIIKVSEVETEYCGKLVGRYGNKGLIANIDGCSKSTPSLIKPLFHTDFDGDKIGIDTISDVALSHINEFTGENYTSIDIHQITDVIQRMVEFISPYFYGSIEEPNELYEKYKIYLDTLLRVRDIMMSQHINTLTKSIG